MINSVAIPNSVELINITPYNPLISKCKIKVCWVGDNPNRNKSIITKEVAKELANSLPGSPIVGYYNENNGDFEQHNKIIELKDGKFRLKPTTQAYGFVDLSAKPWFEKFDDEGTIREYLVTEGWLWTEQFPECKRVVEKGNNQSMELSDIGLNAHWTKDGKGNNRFFIINEAIISKLCILGEDVEPCFEGAQIKVEFSMEDDFKVKLFSMMEEIKNMLNEGGSSMDNQVLDNEVVEKQDPAVDPVVEEVEPVVTEPEAQPEGEPATDFADNGEDEKDEDKKEVCPDCGKPISECECDKDDDDEDKPAQYNLEEIPEYVELQANYAALQAENETLSARVSELETANTSLAEFKAATEKVEKQKMIESFYMLSDEDKKDVVENIDTYSLSDIEAKLSVICVRNKVSFDLDDDNKDTGATVFNFNSGDLAGDLTPAWVKAIDDVAKQH